MVINKLKSLDGRDIFQHENICTRHFMGPSGYGCTLALMNWTARASLLCDKLTSNA